MTVVDARATKQPKDDDTRRRIYLCTFDFLLRKLIAYEQMLRSISHESYDDLMRPSRQTDTPRLYLHIGLGKAGSSAIQKFLFDNRAELDDVGFCFWRNIHTHHVLAHKWGGGWLPADWTPKQGYDGLWRELCNAIDQNEKTFIISSERFAAATFETAEVTSYISELLGRFRVKIVLYTRAVAELAESEYKQRVLNGEKIEFEDFIRSLPPYFNYLGIASTWSRKFGRENMIVRDYRRDGLIADFLSALGIPLLAPQTTEPVNVSISASSAKEILRRGLSNRDPRDRVEIASIRRALDNDQSTFLTSETRRQIEVTIARIAEAVG